MRAGATDYRTEYWYVTNLDKSQYRTDDNAEGLNSLGQPNPSFKGDKGFGKTYSLMAPARPNQQSLFKRFDTRVTVSSEGRGSGITTEPSLAEQETHGRNNIQ